MITYETLAKMAEDTGFTACAPLEASDIELKEEVRDMCASNACGQYGKNWSCPPRLRNDGGLPPALTGIHPRYPGTDRG